MRYNIYDMADIDSVRRFASRMTRLRLKKYLKYWRRVLRAYRSYATGRITKDECERRCVVAHHQQCPYEQGTKESVDYWWL